MNQQYAGPGHKEVMPRVVVLKMYHQVMKNYNYLVVDPNSRQAVIVDPAWQMEKIAQALMDAQATLSGILITHSHPDHINLAKPLAEDYDCPIWMSKEEIAASGFNARQLVGIDTNPWAVGQMLIDPIFTPGHTPGSICYLIGDNLFTGDVLFAEGCGMCPDTQAAHAMFASLENLKARLKPQTRIFPGHSYGKPPGQVLSQLLRDNIYLQFSDKNSFAAFRLRSGQNRAKMFSFS
jgi:glyoxylase-like metal-dependent hydrolase (beta-lactamase superfamily II)